ncbi:MAG: efflux RND transporter periplasmic adaptor subunit [Syntrophaceticus sp.]|nr:efflux RND transporter periplasmic adaptor subunit [Syntrophaceticus sp.]
MKKKIAIALGLILIVAVVIGAVIKTNSVSTVNVKTAEAKMMEYEDKVLATGSVDVVDSADLVASLPGKLTLKVQEGDRVEKGQVLAELDVSEQKQQLEDAEDGLQKAQDGLQKAEANLANARKGREEAATAVKEMEEALLVSGDTNNLTKAGTDTPDGMDMRDITNIPDGTDMPDVTGIKDQLNIAKQAYMQAQQAEKAAEGQVDAARSGVETARSVVKTARSAVEKGKLTAPIGGVVLQIATKNGSYVQPTMPLITIGDSDNLQVVANISEQDINGVEVGQKVEVRWAGAPEELVKGEVSRVAPVVSGPSPQMGQTETSIKVYLSIENGEALKPGATVDVVIYRVTPRQSLLIPNEAITEEGESKTIFVVEDGTAKKVNIQTGHSNELYTEIKKGIKENTVVILEPQDIEEGQKVRLTGGVSQ